jgi:hypothetical protein
VISRVPAGLVHQSPTASGQPKVVMAMIGLAAAARIVRDRRTYERVVIFAIVVAAAAGLARENQARSRARLVAWYQRTMGG